MTDERNVQETWREVGKRFEALAESLAQAIQTAWEKEDTQQHLESVQGALRNIADTIDREISEASTSPQARRVRQEAEKAAESARAAGKQTWTEARPQVLSALTKVNAELEQLIERMEREEIKSEGESPGDESPQST